jgi:TatD DNase family protein
VGDRLLVGGTRGDGVSRGANETGVSRGAALLEVTMIGKECKTPCRIYYQVGACIMPQEGVFCRVLEPGRVRTGDTVRIERV